MFGAVSFYSEMTAAGIRPIIGYEAFVASTSLSNYGGSVASGERPYYNLVLLAEDAAGYQNLVKLSSKAFTEGLRYKPLIDLDLLAQHSTGLIGLSGGSDGSVAHYLLNANQERALETAKQLEEILGERRFFLELIDHGLPEQTELNHRMTDLSKMTGIPVVATNSASYLNPDDARAHEVMICIGEGRMVRNGGEPSNGTTKMYVRSTEEMWTLFGRDHPEALRNTLEIAERCNVELSVNGDDLILPHFPIPKESGMESLSEYFEAKVAEGFEQRRQTILQPMRDAGRLRYEFEVYEQRLDREIEVIEGMGYEGYFLIVWDFINFAVERGIPVGPGRGSAAGSLVAYCLGITGIDPIQYDLLFERFLNPERVSMPDIDIDFCIRGRSEVIDHVTATYGRESVCQIITFGTMASKAAIKDVGRALNMPYGEVERIAKLIPPPIRGRNVSISRALETVSELRALVEKDPSVKDLVGLAMKLEGCSRHTSVHAAGVVIAPKPLHDIVPVAVSTKGELTSQYSMNDLEKVGMLKMDFLALTTLTIIDDCLRSLRERAGVEIDWNSIPLNEEKTMALFAEGRTDAVFQFESSGMQEICRRLKPKEFEDLSALNALYRPGPLDGGLVEDFIQRHRGEKEVEYLLPEMEEILENTFGVPVYQEQIMQLAQKLAGYSLGEADVMRRAMGKKKREAMAKEEIKFVEGACRNGIDKEKANEIFKLIEQFADYGFNRSHSIAYAYLAFQTAYLKAHYPAYFFASVLTHEADDSAKIYKYAMELRSMGLKLLPPDINESGEGFTPLHDSVRFGLSAIKGIGATTVNAIVEARRDGYFTSLHDLVSRVAGGAVNKRGLESLIYSGAFDSLMPAGRELNEWRAQNFAAIDAALAFGQRSWSDRVSGQNDLFGTLRSKDTIAEFDLPSVPGWSRLEMSQNEKLALGFYLSSHPLDEFRHILDLLQIKPLVEYGSIPSGAKITLAGIVSSPQVRYSKKGNRFSTFRLEDRSAGIKCLVWAEPFERLGKLINEGALLIAEGRLEITEGNEQTLIVNDLRSLSDAEADNAKVLSLCLPTDTVNEETLFRVLSLLDESRGECQVEMTIPLAGFALVEVELPAFRIKGSARMEGALKGLGCEVSWRL